MANYVFNIAKGRAAEFFSRVKNNDPANSAIVLIPLSATDVESNRQDDADVSTFLAAAPNEQTAGGWVRKVLTDTELGTVAPDNSANRFVCTLPTVVWTTPSVGNNVVGLLVAYDNDTTSGTDSNLIPIAHCDFAVTADGASVTLPTGPCVVTV